MSGKKTRAKRRKAFLSMVLSIALLMGMMPGYKANASWTIRGPRTSNGVTTWDKVTFGRYDQDFVPLDQWEKEPIKWRILSVNEDRTDAFVMADEAIDCMPYNSAAASVKWETCSIRAWLNGTGVYQNGGSFINSAFTAEEQEAILTTTVDGNESTKDKIYLLSEAEATTPSYGFSSDIYDDSSRLSIVTDYAAARGAEVVGSGGIGLLTECKWWLRLTVQSTYAPYIDWEGCCRSINDDHKKSVDRDDVAVRPVMHIDLTSQYVTEVKKEHNWDYDCVYFGSYRRTAEYQNNPIEWRVLSVDDKGVALLLADKALDCRQFNYGDWEYSDVREWLNGLNSFSGSNSFIATAFTEAERAVIIPTETETVERSGGDGGTETVTLEDTIFVINKDDVKNASYGFKTTFDTDDTARIVKPTDFAEMIHADRVFYNGNADWWLRDYTNENNIFYVDSSGCGYNNHEYNYYAAVRPALRVDINSPFVEYAGTVSVNGENITATTAQHEYAIEATRLINIAATAGNPASCKDEVSAKIFAAREAYDLLNDDGKEEVSAETKAQLAAAEEKLLDSAKHRLSDEVSGVDATCTENGNVAYHICADCGRMYQNVAESEGALVEVSNPVIPATGHNLTPEEANDPTCTDDGNSAYWSCSNCHKYFSDADAVNEIEENSWVIEATGHSFCDPSYTWADDNSTCRAFRECTAEGCGHEETETVDTTSAVTTPATCINTGIRTYTAAFTNTAFETQTNEEVIGKDSSNHQGQTEVRNAKEATCNEAGYTGDTYCADCGVKIRSGDPITKKGHDYNITYKWSDDGHSCTAKAVCKREGCQETTQGHTVTETVEYIKGDAASKIKAAVKSAATQSAMGITTYTATFENDLFEQQTKDVTDIAKLAPADPTATPTPTPTDRPTVTPTPTENPTVTPTPTDNPTVTPTPTDNPTVTPTPTDRPTVTPTPTENPTVTPTPTDKPTVAPAPTPTDNPTVTPTPTQTPADDPVITPAPTPAPADNQAAPAKSPEPTPTATPAPEDKGTPLTISQANVKVVVTSKEGETPTVEYKGEAETDSKNVTIPSSVTYGGVTYKVTSIGDNAFKGDKKVESITIPGTVNKIGSNAFSKTPNLKVLKIKSTKLKAKDLSKKAFSGLNKKTVIKVKKSKLKDYKSMFPKKGLPANVKIKKL